MLAIEIEEVVLLSDKRQRSLRNELFPPRSSVTGDVYRVAMRKTLNGIDKNQAVNFRVVDDAVGLCFWPRPDDDAVVPYAQATFGTKLHAKSNELHRSALTDQIEADS